MVRGDGFCLLTAIRVALEKDYNITCSEVQLQQMILAHVRHKGAEYLKWYPGNKEQLFQDLLEFFSTKNYQQNVVDILVRIAADALYINIHIYQMSAMETQRFLFSPSPLCEKIIYLQFLRNPKYEMMNHYNPLIKKETAQKKESVKKELHIQQPTFELTESTQKRAHTPKQEEPTLELKVGTQKRAYTPKEEHTVELKVKKTLQEQQTDAHVKQSQTKVQHNLDILAEVSSQHGKLPHIQTEALDLSVKSPVPKVGPLDLSVQSTPGVPAPPTQPLPVSKVGPLDLSVQSTPGMPSPPTQPLPVSPDISVKGE